MINKDFMNRDIYAQNEKVGTVKDIEVDPTNWQITHLQIELTKEISESVLGANKGGVRNMLAISALENGAAGLSDRGLNLKVSTGQLHTYLRAAA